MRHKAINKCIQGGKHPPCQKTATVSQKLPKESPPKEIFEKTPFIEPIFNTSRLLKGCIRTSIAIKIGGMMRKSKKLAAVAEFACKTRYTRPIANSRLGYGRGGDGWRARGGWWAAHGVESVVTPAATAQIVSRPTGVYRSSVSDSFSPNLVSHCTFTVVVAGCTVSL